MTVSVAALAYRHIRHFIPLLIQHLDPTHQSLMVDLLAGHTAMEMHQAADGMLIERDHVYVIPPGDSEGLAARIRELAADRSRARAMGERGRKLYEEKFAPRVAFEAWERILT